MFKNYLRHKLVGESLRQVRGIGVVEMQDVRSTMNPGLERSESYLFGLLYAVIFCLIIGADVVEGKITPPAQSNNLVGNSSALDNVRHNQPDRRDPFKRIEKRMPTPRVLKKSPPVPPVPGVEDPPWRLLGVFHGHDGHQAVIQLSPKDRKDRIVVQIGSKLNQSGWTVKSINEEGILLEHLSSNPSKDPSSSTRNLNLSFPAIPQSP